MTRVTGEWLTAPGTQAVMGLLEEAGYMALAVGGCVRNALLEVPVTDVDIATDARPEQVMTLAEAAGLKPVPTGIDHGTVTVVAGHTGYEVTTFRADVETDGRRAVVRFSTELIEDARRRDFTMNALYANRYGQLYDPLAGLADLQARRLRFIEDPVRRIREDYLRILRFFRFTAWYGDDEAGMDAESLAAIAGNLDGLQKLSRERVGHEIVKLMAAPDPTMAVHVMARTGVLARVLPGAAEHAVGPLVHHERGLGLDADPMRRLAATGFSDGAALRLSKAQQRQLGRLAELVSGTAGSAEIAWRHGATTAREVAALRAASLSAPLPDDLDQAVAHGVAAVFPVAPKDLMPGLSGPALGAALAGLERAWIESGFMLDRPALLARAGRGDTEGDPG